MSNYTNPPLGICYERDEDGNLIRRIDIETTHQLIECANSNDADMAHMKADNADRVFNTY